MFRPELFHLGASRQALFRPELFRLGASRQALFPLGLFHRVLFHPATSRLMVYCQAPYALFLLSLAFQTHYFLLVFQTHYFLKE